MQFGWYDRRLRRARDLSCGAWRIYLELEVRRVWCRSCGHVKRERLEFLTDNALRTKRFAYQVGRRCRNCTIKEVAEELHLDWRSVKDLDKQCMLACARTVAEADVVLARYREDYNRRFAVAATERTPAWRPLPAGTISRGSAASATRSRWAKTTPCGSAAAPTRFVEVSI